MTLLSISFDHLQAFRSFIPAFAAFFWYRWRIGKKAALKHSDPGMLPQPGPLLRMANVAKKYLPLVALCAAIAIAAKPVGQVAQYNSYETAHHGCLVVDVSGSMFIPTTSTIPENKGKRKIDLVVDNAIRFIKNRPGNKSCVGYF